MRSLFNKLGTKVKSDKFLLLLVAFSTTMLVYLLLHGQTLNRQSL